MINYHQVRNYVHEHPKKPSSAHGPKILVAGFAAIILLGTALLRLPLATAGPESLTWVEALFTATSAVTVTGLIVVGTEATFSTFGEVVILILIQVGGIGFITLSVLLFQLIGRRVTLYERNLVSQTLGLPTMHGVVQLTLIVIVSTVIIELVGAIFIFSQFIEIMEWHTALYYAVFHSVSAFCNAGFDLFSGLDDPRLIFTRNNPLILIVMSLLITIGTLGITVIYDLVVWPQERRMSLHTKLVLPLTIGLTIIGTILVLIDEGFVAGHALTQIPVEERFLVAVFTVISSRTAGLTLIPMDELGQASQLVILIWMFIGGAPASMGGGVGLSTVAVVLITLQTTVLGYRDVRVLKRTLPTETIIKAVAVLTVSTILVVTITLLLLLLEQGSLFTIGFEVVSAFSNTGYSLGITSSLDTIGRLLVAFTMFWGRLGPLTLVVALAQRRRQTLVTYPEEKIIIG